MLKDSGETSFSKWKQRFHFEETGELLIRRNAAKRPYQKRRPDSGLRFGLQKEPRRCGPLPAAATCMRGLPEPFRKRR
jgi:hypothetical protein